MVNEINRVVKLFTDLQHGQCWIGVNFREVLHGVDAAQAATLKGGEHNTIWQLVSHITYWRTRVVYRLTGSDNPPPFPDFMLPAELTDSSWRQTLADFESAYHLLRTALLRFKEENYDKPSPKEGQTFFELIMGCLQHDAYHLGQIMLLKKINA